MGKKIPGPVWIFIGFVPWILYWAFSGPGLWTEQEAGAVFWLSFTLPFVIGLAVAAILYFAVG